MRTKVMAGVAVALLAMPMAPAPANPAKIKATFDDKWSPDFKHVPKGKKVVFKNPSENIHDLKRYRGPWKKGRVYLYPGDRWRTKLKEKGTYRYRCVLHSQMSSGKCIGMCGVIHVGPR